MNRHFLCCALRNRVQIQSLHPKRKNKGHHTGVPQVWPGIRLWRRYPHSTPEKRAFRSPSGVCEPAFLVLRTAEPSSNPMPTPQKKKIKDTTRVSFIFWRCRPDLNRRITVLQTGALPLGYCTELLFAHTLYQSFSVLSSAFRDYFEKVLLRKVFIKKISPKISQGRDYNYLVCFSSAEFYSAAPSCASGATSAMGS